MPSPTPTNLRAEDAAALERVRKLAHTLDTSITLPGGFRIGWEAIIGLIPGLGDSAGALLSAYIVLEAIRLGAPRAVLLRMVGNVAVDAALGTIPFAGDIFDAAFKANARNARLMESFLTSPTRTKRASAFWVLFALLAIALMLGAALAVAFLIIRGFANLLS